MLRKSGNARAIDSDVQMTGTTVEERPANRCCALVLAIGMESLRSHVGSRDADPSRIGLETGDGVPEHGPRHGPAQSMVRRSTGRPRGSSPDALREVLAVSGRIREAPIAQSS